MRTSQNYGEGECLDWDTKNRQSYHAYAHKNWPYSSDIDYSENGIGGMWIRKRLETMNQNYRFGCQKRKIMACDRCRAFRIRQMSRLGNRGIHFRSRCRKIKRYVQIPHYQRGNPKRPLARAMGPNPIPIKEGRNEKDH